MSNPMAQSEPVEQRFGAPASNEAEQAPAPTRQIDGTDVVEQGSLAADNVLEALKDVIDPELGINIVDLGLVYGVVIGPENQVRLDMTLTSAACPLTDVIERQAHTILSGVTDEVQINWVWMPPWGRTASRRTAASSFARSASTSELPVFSVSPEPLGSGDTRMQPHGHRCHPCRCPVRAVPVSLVPFLMLFR